MKFTLEIELGNDAVQGYSDLSALTIQTATRINAGAEMMTASPKVGDGGKVRDINGNTCGSWAVVPTFGDPHLFVGVGHCKLCGHYGQDCTGSREEVEA